MPAPNATKFSADNTPFAGRARIFFALWPDAFVRSRIAAIGRQLPESQGHFVASRNLHITLSFIGEVDQEQLRVFTCAVEDVNSTPFTLVLDCLGFFARTRVLWLGCKRTPATLLTLVTQLNTTLRRHGYQPERRPFAPHATLLRKARPLAALPEFEPVNWHISHFVLVQSVRQHTGVSYQVLKEFKFAC